MLRCGPDARHARSLAGQTQLADRLRHEKNAVTIMFGGSIECPNMSVAESAAAKTWRENLPSPSLEMGIARSEGGSSSQKAQSLVQSARLRQASNSHRGIPRRSLAVCSSGTSVASVVTVLLSQWIAGDLRLRGSALRLDWCALVRAIY